MVNTLNFQRTVQPDMYDFQNTLGHVECRHFLDPEPMHGRGIVRGDGFSHWIARQENSEPERFGRLGTRESSSQRSQW